MVTIEDGIAYVSQNIGYIVTIIGTGALTARYVSAEVKKHADRVEKKVLGPEGNAKVGKGGAIDDLRSEFQGRLDSAVKELENKISKSQDKLIFEYRSTTQKIDFVVSNLSRMERSLEKVTDGKYTAARMETNREDGYNSIDNPSPGEAEGDSLADNYNKRRRRD